MNAKNIRLNILKMIYKGQASHIASSFSCVEILEAIYRNIDIGKIVNYKEERDRVILSKGHAAATLYATLKEYGVFDSLDTFHQNGTYLAGHATHYVKGVEHSTGALGHGLPVAVGIALGLKAKCLGSRVYVIIGDGELQEGSNWEAIRLAGQLKLNNLCLFIDKNNMAGIGKIQTKSLYMKLMAFDFATFSCNGHNGEGLDQYIAESKHWETPVAIICETVKGKGVSFMENNNIWHYRPPNREEYEMARRELKGGD